MYACMCDWVTLLYSRKMTEHCKQAIMKKIKIIRKKTPNINLYLTPKQKDMFLLLLYYHRVFLLFLFTFTITWNILLCFYVVTD